MTPPQRVKARRPLLPFLAMLVVSLGLPLLLRFLLPDHLAYTSDWRPGGLPFIDIAVDGRHHGSSIPGNVANGWIAIGQVAIGRLAGVGVTATGVIAIGVGAIGIFSFGVLAIAVAMAAGVMAVGQRAWGVSTYRWYAPKPTRQAATDAVTAPAVPPPR